MGLDIPDFAAQGYYGAHYGTMKPFHQAGRLLFLSGHVPQTVDTVIHPGRLGDTQNFVVCTPDYTDVHRVSSGLSDLMVEVFGPDRGLGGRATIGVMALANGACFETWAIIEVDA